MASYETTVIVRPGCTEDQVTALKTKVESLLKDHEGALANYEDWGTRRMFYKIRKEGKGRYVYFGYTGNNATVAEVERNLRINENVLRFLSVCVSQEENVETLSQPTVMKRPRKTDDAAKLDGFYE